MNHETLHEIRDVALLDLTGAGAAHALEGVSAIRDVATILVPESLMARLSSISLRDVAATVPVPDGKRVKVMTGQIVLSGEALAGSEDGPDEVLVIIGQLVVTSPIERMGYHQVIAIGQVLAPAGSETGLGAGLARMTGQIRYYPYTQGAAVRVLTGMTRLSGADLANPTGQATDILISVGQLVVSGPVDTLGYQHVVALGHVLIPREAEPVFAGRVTTLGGEVVAYTAPPRVFDGKDTFYGAFFELLDDPVTLVLHGKFTFNADVAPDVLKQKVAAIVLSGKIIAPHSLVPLLQVLTIARTGKITTEDDGD
jgi:hypothetical protein